MTDKLDKFMGFDRALSVTGDRGGRGRHQTILQEMEEAMTGGQAPREYLSEEKKLTAVQRRTLITDKEQTRLAKWLNAHPEYLNTTEPVRVPPAIRLLMNKVIGNAVEIKNVPAAAEDVEDFEDSDLEEGWHSKQHAKRKKSKQGPPGILGGRQRTTKNRKNQQTNWGRVRRGDMTAKEMDDVRKAGRGAVQRDTDEKGERVRRGARDEELAWSGDRSAAMAEGGAYGRDVGPEVTYSGEGQYKRSTNAGVGPYGRRKRGPRRERVQNRPWPDFQGQGMERGEDVEDYDEDGVDEEARAFLEPSVVPSDNANAARFVYRDSYITKPRRKTPMFTNEDAEEWDAESMLHTLAEVRARRGL